MKKETKELIDWIKKQISLAGTIVTDASQPYWQQDRDKAIKFLDSLPVTEHRLCLGGYIQDRNGTPIGHGDTVKVFCDGAIEPYDKATLNWNAPNHQFYLIKKKFGTPEWSFDSKLIEKDE